MISFRNSGPRRGHGAGVLAFSGVWGLRPFGVACVLGACLITPVDALAQVTVDQGGYAAREVDRSLVLPPGVAEAAIEGEYTLAARYFDRDAATRALPAGAAARAATATIRGRYGLFRSLEVFAEGPWIVRLDPEGDRAVSGAGRAAIGARYQLSPKPITFLAADLAAVLPTTAPRLRTGADGTIHRDHLAVAGTLHLKQRLFASGAAHASAGFVAPFANADDEDAGRDPPSSFFVVAGSTFQLSDRWWADASGRFTRTNRDRVAGGVVPRSDQFLAELRPTLGANLRRDADLEVTTSLPVAGKNTPQSFGVTATVRIRF